MPQSSEKRLGYQSYLLRLWRSTNDGLWQISVHRVQTAEEWHFVSSEALFHFLLACMETDRTV